MSAAGFFGKVPARGDFVERGLPRPLTDALETWAKAGLASFAERRPQSWLQDYLVSPVWRFAGECSGGSWAGVLCPSVDAAGRYFPLAIATEQASSGAGHDFFEDAEELARSALKPEGFDLVAWAARVSALKPPFAVTAGWRSGAILQTISNSLFSEPSYADLLEGVVNDVEAAP